jgi:predicted GIY-YIG superfamily endonuclease
LKQVRVTRFTDWQLLRTEDGHWAYKEDIEDDGPACYELGISRLAGNVHTVYVGHATNLRKRMHDHAIGDKTTRRFMEKSIANGFKVYFRFHRMSSSSEAEELEKKHIQKSWWKYCWNKVGSPWHPIHPPQ